AVTQGDQCVPQILCGTAACADNQYCDRFDAAGPTCKALPCGTGKAMATDGKTCSTCTRPCTGPGFTGRYWPFQTNDGSCVCETVPGYFVPGGGSGQATLCDADEDGWVRADADDSTIHLNSALLQNARCNILSIDGVLLHDEYGISVEVASCTEGLVMAPAAGPAV